MNLNQITLPAIDFESSVKFYREMGFIQIVHAPPRYARFECPEGDTTFSIHLVEKLASENGVVVYFECNELDETVQQLQSKGYTFSKLPTDCSWLWREARLMDPSGNVICLYWAGENRKNPPWKIVA